MNIPRGINRKLLKTYKPVSIVTLTNSLRKVLLDVYNIDKYTLKPFVDKKSFEKYISSVEKGSIRKNYVMGVLAFLRVDPNVSPDTVDFYDKLATNVIREVDVDRMYKGPSEKDKAAYISWESVLSVCDRYKKEVLSNLDQSFRGYDDKYLYMKYMLLKLYTCIPPLRGEEYRNAIILSVMEPSNYGIIAEACRCNLFDIRNSKFVVSYYKTSKTYDMRIIDIPLEVLSVVKKWYKITDGNRYLLPNLQTPSERMSQSAMSNMLMRIFEPNDVSTSMLRKIYISWRLRDIYDNSEERKRLAYIMGHSLEMQEFVYSRFSV